MGLPWVFAVRVMVWWLLWSCDFAGCVGCYGYYGFVVIFRGGCYGFCHHFVGGDFAGFYCGCSSGGGVGF